MERKDTSETMISLNATLLKSSAERQREMSRVWIADYINGLDDGDDFRKKYFKNIDSMKEKKISRQKSSASHKKEAVDSNATSSTEINEIQRDSSKMCRSSTNDDLERITKETEVICSPANPNGGLVIDEKDPDSEGIVVHRTSDVFQQWAWNRTDDECRLWYLKTLKMRKILSDSPSIKQQNSIH